MAYDAITVANYIVSSEARHGRLVSNLRLQKLLYFVQAQILTENGCPCFDDTIEAWDFGPVVPSVYRRFKIYGSMSIPTQQIIDEKIDHKTAGLIDEMLDGCADYSTGRLVEITHGQKPWRQARNSFSGIITNQSILDYFGE